MMSRASPTGSRYVCMLLIVIAALIGTLLSLQLAHEVGNGAFRSDYFRHFYYTVIPYLDGSGSPALLFKNHHASPLMHAHQMVSSLLLDFSLRFDAYIGIVLFFCMAVGLAAMAYGEIAVRSGSQLYALAVALLVCLLMTGLTSSTPIAWPLIYLQAYFYGLGLLLAVAAYRLCVRPTSTERILLYLAAATLAVLLHTSYGMLFFVASIPALVFRALSERDYRLLLPLLIAAGLVVVWNNLLLPAMGQMESRGALSSTDSIAALIIQLPLVVAAFGKALLTGIHGDAIAYIVNMAGPAFWKLAIFAGLAIAYTLTAARALLQARRVQVAGVIMLAVLLGSASALLSRGGDAFAFNIDAPRYVLLYRLAMAAFVWALADALLSLGRSDAPQKAGGLRVRGLTVAALAGVFAVAVVQVIALGNIHDRKEELSTQAGWSELAVYMRGVDSDNTFTLQGWQSGGNAGRVNRRVLAWLAGRQVNVFSPGYRPSPHLADYKRGSLAYRDGQLPVSLPVDAGNCVEHPGFEREQAWNARLYAPISGRFSLPREPVGGRSIDYFIRPGLQNTYGILPSGTPLQVCFPADVTVESFSLLPARGG